MFGFVEEQMGSLKVSSKVRLLNWIRMLLQLILVGLRNWTILLWQFKIKSSEAMIFTCLSLKISPRNLSLWKNLQMKMMMKLLLMTQLKP
jgi:hypothetical protein